MPKHYNELFVRFLYDNFRGIGFYMLQANPKKKKKNRDWQKGKNLTFLKQWSVSLKVDIETADLESTRLGTSGFSAEEEWTFQCSWQVSSPRKYWFKIARILKLCYSINPTKLKATILLPLSINSALLKCFRRLGKSGVILVKNSLTAILVNPAGGLGLLANNCLAGVK